MEPDRALMWLAWIGAAAGPPAAWWAWTSMGPARAGRRIAGLVAFAAAYGLGVWAFLIEPETLVVRHVTVESPTWRGPPVRLGVMSDLHVGGPHMPAARVARIVAQMNREAPDIVLLLGDYVGGASVTVEASQEPGQPDSAPGLARPHRQEIERGIAALAGLRSRFGTLAILGNHDWWYGGREIERRLWAAKAPVMENYAQRIGRPEGAFWVAGLADYASPRSRPSVTEALAAVPPREPVIVLTHWPDAWPMVPRAAALTLAGHSHCGQVNLPVLGRPITPSPGAARWPCGRYDEDGRILYVTGGLGVSILPVRFRAPPEIVIVSLRGPPQN